MFNKVLIVGMGSAGRRYLRIARELGIGNVDVLRSGKGTITEEILPAPDKIFYNINEAFDNEYDTVIVSTPSALHYEYIMEGLRNGINVLTEKPATDNIEQLYEIKSFLGNSSLKFGVCHNLRYHPAIRNLKRYVETGVLGEPICASVQFCAYLPEWHPWEDYKNSYAAKKDLGGGAALTHIHEVDFLNWIFGKPARFNGIKADKKFIGTNVDECTLINIEHDNGVVSQLLLSLNTKPSKRNILVYFTKGKLEIDLITAEVNFESGFGENIETETKFRDFNFDDTYSDMLKDFSGLIETAKSDICSIDDAIESTKIVTGI